MTSVPKPFKFLKDHYENLVKFYETAVDSDFKVFKKKKQKKKN